MNAIIEAFQIQVCGSSGIFVHEYKFHNRFQGTNESFEEFYTDLQTLLNKCHFEDCCKTEARMSCKDSILSARLKAGIRSNEVCKGLLCIKDLTLEKALKHVQVDEATSFQANQFSSQIKKLLLLPTNKTSQITTVTETVHLLLIHKKTTQGSANSV